MTLHIQSLFIVVGFGIVVTGFGLLLVIRFTPGSIVGGLSWAFGNIAQFSGYILLGLRDQIDDIFSIVGGNSIIAISFVFYYIALA